MQYAVLSKTHESSFVQNTIHSKLLSVMMISK